MARRRRALEITRRALRSESLVGRHDRAQGAGQGTGRPAAAGGASGIRRKAAACREKRRKSGRENGGNSPCEFPAGRFQTARRGPAVPRRRAAAPGSDARPRRAAKTAAISTFKPVDFERKAANGRPAAAGDAAGPIIYYIYYNIYIIYVLYVYGGRRRCRADNILYIL